MIIESRFYSIISIITNIKHISSVSPITLINGVIHNRIKTYT